MQILGQLAVPGTISAVLVAVVRLVRVILDYRVRCKEIELLREQREPVPDSEPVKAARTRQIWPRRRLH